MAEDEGIDTQKEEKQKYDAEQLTLVISSLRSKDSGRRLQSQKTVNRLKYVLKIENSILLVNVFLST